MNLLNYSLISILSFLGLIAGLIVMASAKEEQRPGRKYFEIIQKLALLSIIISLFYFIGLNLIILILISLIIIIYLQKYKNPKLKESYYIFPLLGVILYQSSNNPDFLFLQSALIFLYGLITGSMLMKKGENLKTVLKSTSFLFVTILLYLIF
jgi:membrane-associated HD superfamily phosphohydrolase